jgi:uncharacterized protein YbdZ (MbtH family)
VFTARYGLSPYIKQIRFVFKGLNLSQLNTCVRSSRDTWCAWTQSLALATRNTRLQTVGRRVGQQSCRATHSNLDTRRWHWSASLWPLSPGLGGTDWRPHNHSGRGGEEWRWQLLRLCSITSAVQESLWRTGGMILAGWNRSTQRKSSVGATLSITNPIWTDLGLNPGLHSERLVLCIRQILTIILLSEHFITWFYGIFGDAAGTLRMSGRKESHAISMLLVPLFDSKHCHPTC